MGGNGSASSGVASTPGASSRLATMSAMAFNFLTSVGIINLNKVVFVQYAFHYPTLLTAIHFAITTLGLLCCHAAGMFTIKHVPMRQILPLALSFTGFVIFNNLSLQMNSLGFYQLMKVLTTPAIVVIQLVAFGVPLHNKLKLALLPICVGVALATVSDVEINPWGVFWALAGIVSTSFYQIWVKSKQQDLQLNSYQLLFLQAPVSFVLVMILSFLTEDYTSPATSTAPGVLAYPYTRESVLAIVGTGVLSFCVNLSIFLVIGRTSPIAYNVLGHFKLVCILASGFVFFAEDANAVKIFGTLLTLAGVVIYTHLQQNLNSGWEARERDARANAAATAASATTKTKLLTLDADADGDDLEAGTLQQRPTASASPPTNVR